MTEDPGNAGGAKGFVTNMFKNPFKKDGDTSRKPSDAGSLTGVTATGESSENKGIEFHFHFIFTTTTATIYISIF